MIDHNRQVVGYVRKVYMRVMGCTNLAYLYKGAVLKSVFAEKFQFLTTSNTAFVFRSVNDDKFCSPVICSKFRLRSE